MNKYWKFSCNQVLGFAMEHGVPMACKLLAKGCIRGVDLDVYNLLFGLYLRALDDGFFSNLLSHKLYNLPKKVYILVVFYYILAFSK